MQFDFVKGNLILLDAILMSFKKFQFELLNEI